MDGDQIVAAGKVVSIDFVLKDSEGKELQRTTESKPLVYLHGTHSIVAGLEEALEGKTAGDSVSVTVPPEKGYGPKRNVKPQRILRSKFPENTKLDKGSRFVMGGPDGKPFSIWVTKVQGREVYVTPEHPMAGKVLFFEATVREVRDASDEEKAHGHAHGPGVHDHEEEE